MEYIYIKISSKNNVNFKIKMKFEFYYEAMDFIKVVRILCSKEIIESGPDFVLENDILMVFYTLN